MLHEVEGNKSKDGQEISPITRFDRIRVIDLSNDGFINCSCGEVNQYMWPCRHIIAFLLKYHPTSINEYLFHMRYWNIFNYYFLSSFGKDMIGNKSIDAMSMLLKGSFNDKGTFLGCRCNSKQINEMLLDSNLLIEEKTKNIAMFIARMNKPIQKDDRSYLQQYEINVEAFEEEINHDSNIEFDTFCGDQEGSFLYLSPSRQVLVASNTLPASQNINDHELYHEFNAIFNILETKEEHEVASRVLKELFHQINNMKNNSTTTASLSQDDVVMLNEYRGNRILTNKRKKSAFEK